MGDIADTEVSGDVQPTRAVIDLLQRLGDFNHTRALAASEIDDLPIGRGDVERFDDGRRDILHVDEITAFVPVLEDVDILVIQKQRGEDL